MNGNGYRKIVIEKIIKEETRRAAERLGHFNHLDAICLNSDLSPEEHTEVYEGVLRNVIRICESRLKNGFSKRERYIAAKKKKGVSGAAKKPDGWIPPEHKFD